MQLINNLPTSRSIEFIKEVKELFPFGVNEVWLFRFKIVPIGYYCQMQLFLEIDDTKLTLTEIIDDEENCDSFNFEKNDENVRLLEKNVISLLRNNQTKIKAIEIENLKR